MLKKFSLISILFANITMEMISKKAINIPIKLQKNSKTKLNQNFKTG